MDPTFLNRNVNQGFSGGEKKRNEILQLAVLEVSRTMQATRAGVHAHACVWSSDLLCQHAPCSCQWICSLYLRGTSRLKTVQTRRCVVQSLGAWESCQASEHRRASKPGNGVEPGNSVEPGRCGAEPGSTVPGSTEPDSTVQSLAVQ